MTMSWVVKWLSSDVRACHQQRWTCVLDLAVHVLPLQACTAEVVCIQCGGRATLGA